jgi:hypothetical protein
LEKIVVSWTNRVTLGPPGNKICRGGIAGRKDYARDKLTNGSKTLPDTDGRLRIARRFRDIAAPSWSIRRHRTLFGVASATDLGRVKTQTCFLKVEFPSRNRSP